MNSVGRCPFHQSHDNIDKLDLIDPHARTCPHPFYRWLQEKPERRIYKAPFEKSFYVVHRYEDVKLVLTNTKLFSSAILPTKKSPFLALMDGEEHLRQREVASKIFQVDHPDFPRDSIREYIRKASQEFIDKKYGDVFEEWATPIPLASLCIVLGITPDKKIIGQLHNDAVIINRALFVLGGTGPRRNPNPTFPEKLSIAFSLIRNISSIKKLKQSMGEEGWGDFRKMFLPIKTEFENPRPDFRFVPNAVQSLLELMHLFSKELTNNSNQSHGMRILRQAINENKISKVEAVMLCTFILFAGYETTVSLLSNSIYHLTQDASLFSQLRGKPDLIESFMEESLRYYTPVGRFLRRANEDVSIGDQVIPKGSMIVAMLGSANVDPDRFEEPFNFNRSREKNQHMSFGKGIHFCVGAPLARFQVTAALTEITASASRILLDENRELKMVTDRDNGILRYEELWVKIS